MPLVLPIASSTGDDFLYIIQNRLVPSKKNGLVNQSYSISGGKKFDINDNPLSFYLLPIITETILYEEDSAQLDTTGELSQDMIGKKSNVRLRKS